MNTIKKARRIPKLENLQERKFIKIKVRKIKKDYFGALKGIKPYTREDRTKDRE